MGDGHCLLHSLEPGCDVVRLRQDIVATLREEAALNVEFMDSYNEEADWLEEDPDLWGGQLTMVAFSRLRAVKVLVHNSRDLDEILYDNSHPDISESAPEVHIAFNGLDHYDAVEVMKEGIFTATTSTATPTKTRGLASRLRKESVTQKPLFPQFPFNEELMEAMIVEGSQIAAKDNNAASSDMQVENSVTTPPRKARTFTAKQSLATDKRMKQQIKTPRVQQQILKRRPAPPVRRRCPQKVPAPPAYKLTIYEEVCKAELRYPSKHPHVELEDEMLPIKSALRADPTLPPGRLEASIDNGDLWPDVFCAFIGCTWEKMRGTEADLLQHLKEEHFDELIHAAKVLPMKVEEDVAILSVYNEAIADILRTQAPLAGPSLDRKALRSFSEATKGDNVEALVCFCCGCIHTCVAEEEDKNKIQWVFPVEHTKAGGTTLFGMPIETATTLIGMDTFKKKYGKVDGYANITDTDELDDWRSFVYDTSEEDFVEFMCCPEDHVCVADLDHPRDHLLCEECRVPLCSHCRGHLDKHKLPPLSLANDMWTGFAPAILYRERVTVMEMICASPCITTLLCFSMEARYHNDHLFDEKAHMARHRIGARGNALTFPLPWEQLIDTLPENRGGRGA